MMQNPTHEQGHAAHPQLSSTEFTALGVGAIAYVKEVTADGKTAFAIHGADGTPLALAANRDLAFAVVRQNELEPLSVH
jgi:hypothetical protein